MTKGADFRVNAPCRACRPTVVHTQFGGGSGHPVSSGTPGWMFMPKLHLSIVSSVIHKTSTDAFDGTDLDGELRRRFVDSVYRKFYY